MTPKQIKEIQKAVAESIEKTVNGKIAILTQEFREHKMIVSEYIKDDTEWKIKAQPVITMGDNVQGFGRVSLYIVGFIAAMLGAVIMITNFLQGK